MIESASSAKSPRWSVLHDEFLLLVVPGVLNDNGIRLELLLGLLASNHLKNGVQIVAHVSISSHNVGVSVCVDLIRGRRHRGRQVHASRLEPEIELLEVGAEVLLPKGHVVIVNGVVVIHAEIDELLLHLFDDGPTLVIVLLLESFLIKLYKARNDMVSWVKDRMRLLTLLGSTLLDMHAVFVVVAGGILVCIGRL